MERIKDTLAEVLMTILPVSLVVYILIMALSIPRPPDSSTFYLFDSEA